MIYQLDGELPMYGIKPRWPIEPTLLTNNTGLDFSNKDQWGAAEWRTYSQWLEVEGRRKIERLESELRAANARLTRRTKPRTPVRRGTLLGGYEPVRRGRPKGSSSCNKSLIQAYARRALAKKTVGKMTNVEALRLVFEEDKNITSWKPDKKSVLNAMSKSSLNR